jgi:uncharacterized protein YbaP (TraB family)
MIGRWSASLKIAIVLLVPAAAAAAALPSESEFATLPRAKALAVMPADSSVHGLAQGEPNDLAAALAALKACDAARDATQPPCEILRLNDERITSGAEIRAQVPRRVHPLSLWRVEATSATVFLAGSVHMLKPSLYPLPSPYDDAFARADHLVVEVDVTVHDQEALSKTMAFATLPAGQRLDEILPAAMMARLTSAIARYGIGPAQVATLTPAMLMNQLVVLRLMTLGYRAEHGMDQHFLARRGDRQLLELESLDDQLKLLFDQPMELQLQLLSDTLDQDGTLESVLAQMITAWLSGDDEVFMTMFERESGDSELARQFTEALLSDRNLRMAAKIEEYLDRPGTYFVVVGAAHLIGDEGVPALLKRSGWKPQRIFSDGSMQNL